MKTSLIITTVASFAAAPREAKAFQAHKGFARTVTQSIPSVTNLALQTSSTCDQNNHDASNDYIQQLTTSSDVGSMNRREFMTKMAVSVSAAAATLAAIPAADAVEEASTSASALSSSSSSESLSSSDSSISSSTTLTSASSITAIDPRYFVAGGACASFSHGLATPFDVVKTKMQADPETFDSGFFNAIKTLIQKDGPTVLLSGLAPTLIGFGVEGAVKFGVYESLKPVTMALLHSDDKFIPYLCASIGAGAVASLMLCPMERTRIKLVTSESTENAGTLDLISKVIKEDGISSLFFGYTTMLFKQVPYTVAKQVSFEFVTAQLLAIMAASSIAPNEETRFITTVASAFLASILACTISQPADILLTKTFKENYDDDPLKNAKIVYENGGIKSFYQGYTARLAHVAAIVTSQLVVYDFLKQLLGLPATGS